MKWDLEGQFLKRFNFIVKTVKRGPITKMEAGIFREEFSAVSVGDGLYRGGTLQHWYFKALGIFGPKEIFFEVKTFYITN